MHPGAVLLITILPASIFMTINYRGELTSKDAGASASSGDSNINKTIKIEFNNNGSVSVNGVGVDGNTSSHQVKIVQVNLGNINTTQQSPSPLPLTGLTPQQHSVNYYGDENDIKDSSVVKKSIAQDVQDVQDVAEVIPMLPTCCALRGKESSATLGHCEVAGSNSVGKGGQGLWKPPPELLSRKESVTVFRLGPPSQMVVEGCSSPLNVVEDVVGRKGSVSFLPNGFLKYRNEYFRREEYCINGFEDGRLEIRICGADCSNPSTPCVQKCCELDELYSLGMNGKRGGCLKLEEHETPWSPTFYHELDKVMSPGEMEALRPHIIHTSPTTFKPQCDKQLTTVYPHGEEVANFLNSVLHKGLLTLPFQLRKDGWLMHPNETTTIGGILRHSRTNKYCIDGVMNYGETEKFSNLERQSVLFVCTIGDEEIGAVNTTSTTTTSTSTTSTTSTTTSTTTTTTTTTTPAPPAPTAPATPPTLPTCCNLQPASGNETSNYCMNLDEKGGGREWTAPAKFMNDLTPQTFLLDSRTALHCKEQRKAFILNYPGLAGGGSPSLLHNGMLQFGSEFFSPGEYCVNGIFENILELLVCKINCSEPESPCIHKCCGPEEIYSLGAGTKGKRGCVPRRSPWRPTLYKDMGGPPLGEEEMRRMRPHLVQRFPPKFQYSCYKNLTLVFPYKKEVVPLMHPLAKIHLEFRLRADGKVMYRHPNIKDGRTGNRMESVFNNVEYCVDGIKGGGGGRREEEEEDGVLFVCAMNPPPPHKTAPPQHPQRSQL